MQLKVYIAGRVQRLALAVTIASAACGQDVAILQWGNLNVVVPGRVPEGLVAVAAGGVHAGK